LSQTAVPGRIEGLPVQISEKAFCSCETLREVYIEEGVTAIGENAFRGCLHLRSVTIPKSTEKIGKNAFFGCEGLTVFGEEGSFTEAYAKEHGIKFQKT